MLFDYFISAMLSATLRNHTSTYTAKAPFNCLLQYMYTNNTYQFKVKRLEYYCGEIIADTDKLVCDEHACSRLI